VIKVFQKRWYDIEFKEFYQLTHKKIATTEFYRCFYNVFYKTYTSWEHLPAPYLSTRRQVAHHLAKIITDKKTHTVLTLGCGNGIVEKELLVKIPNLTIFTYEPDETNLGWLKNLPAVKLSFGKFPDCLPLHQRYDLVYLCDVDPVFSDADYILFLRQIKNLTLAPIILTHVLKPLPTVFSHLKYWTKYILAKLNLYNLGQLLGYSRYFREHQEIFKQAGYAVVQKGSLSKELMWIEIVPI